MKPIGLAHFDTDLFEGRNCHQEKMSVVGALCIVAWAGVLISLAVLFQPPPAYDSENAGMAGPLLQPIDAIGPVSTAYSG